ncbi:MAG: hypothetical protein V2A34_02155 [Lentisphaerota bacterium]
MTSEEIKNETAKNLMEICEVETTLKSLGRDGDLSKATISQNSALNAKLQLLRMRLSALDEALPIAIEEELKSELAVLDQHVQEARGKLDVEKMAAIELLTPLLKYAGCAVLFDEVVMACRPVHDALALLRNATSSWRATNEKLIRHQRPLTK